jgi:site-specific DNA recombinase
LRTACTTRALDVWHDDSSRLSRDNQHFNMLLCLFEFWGISLISVSDGLDTREERAKVAYQFRGIINELYLTDLKKKTHRGQMGQVLRGFSVGSRGYGYASVPDGETKHDKKGRLRADGFKLVIVLEEARIIQRIFRDFIDGKAVTKIAKDVNDERIPTKARLKGGWNGSTISRILKDEKYIGRFVWNRTTTAKDPLTGKIKQVDRPKEDWVVQERPHIRIISDEDWAAAQRRWQEIDGVFPSKRRKKGFEGKQRSNVESHPNHLLSGSLKCGACGGAIGLVSGKGSGYYGCLNASRRACENKVLIARKRLEDKFVAALNEKVLDPELLDQVFQRTATKVKELFAHVPEELRLKKIELNRAETRVHNFIEFIASGRATPTLADALSQAEEQVKSLSADIQSMEAAKDHAFTPPPRAWITARIGKLNHLLATRTEKSALALRRLTGAITLSPQKPEVGKPYYQARCKFDASTCWLRTEVRIYCIGGGAGRAEGAKMKSIPGEGVAAQKGPQTWWRRRPRRRRENEINSRRRCRGPKGPKHGGGAGNRTLLRTLATRLIHADWRNYARFVFGWSRLVPGGSFEDGGVAGHTRNMKCSACGRGPGA